MTITKENVRRYYSPITRTENESHAEAVCRCLGVEAIPRNLRRAALTLSAIERENRNTNRHKAREKQLNQ